MRKLSRKSLGLRTITQGDKLSSTYPLPREPLGVRNLARAPVCNRASWLQGEAQLHHFDRSGNFFQTLAMAPKRNNARDVAQSPVTNPQTVTAAAAPAPATPAKASTKTTQNQNLNVQEIGLGIWQNYLDTTPQRTKLIDAFMAFLVVVGVLQFVYCVIAGNYVRSAQMSFKEG